jgi:hypothetical protein
MFERFQRRKVGGRSSAARMPRRICQRPCATTSLGYAREDFGSKRARSSWATGLAKQYGLSQAKIAPFGWFKPNGTPTKCQVKQGSTRRVDRLGCRRTRFVCGLFAVCLRFVCGLLTVVYNSLQPSIACLYKYLSNNLFSSLLFIG